uniref:Structural molecule n=1 Tax=Rhizophora mucronata TaxID=61149 RepID=A0A2P2K9I8_RHIMU
MEHLTQAPQYCQNLCLICQFVEIPGQELWEEAFQWEVRVDFHLAYEMRMHCYIPASISLATYQCHRRDLLVLPHPRAPLQQHLLSADHLH